MAQNMSAILAAAVPASAPSSTALEEAFTALRTYQPGSARSVLIPIDEAVVASMPNAEAARRIEQRLVAFLSEDLSVVAREYVCSKLGLIGSAASVPALARWLDDKQLAHSARAALEVMPCPEALKALSEALGKTSGINRIGIINSLRARRASASVKDLAALLKDPDPQVVVAAAAALGEIGTSSASAALAEASASVPEPARQGLADARLVCAERLLASGNKTEAMATYKTLAQPDQPKPVQLAAKRGLLMAMQAK